MPIVLSRKELYERVWTDPIQRLSKEFGISDVGLAKVCRRYNIPAPPRGYWAKKQAGHEVERVALPKDAPKGYGDTIQFWPHNRPPGQTPKPEEPPTPLHPAVATELEPENKIPPPNDTTRITHPLLRSTRDYWRATRGSALYWSQPLPPHVHLGVSEATRTRTLRLLQVLFSALEGRGYAVTKNERHEIQVTVLDETCKLGLRERQRQVRVEGRRLGNPDLFEGKNPHDLVFTGELELRVDGRNGTGATVADDKNGLPEERLNEIVVALTKAALAEKEYRAAQERARLAELERERERARVLQLEREERALREAP
jgi:hypothetical protein